MSINHIPQDLEISGQDAESVAGGVLSYASLTKPALSVVARPVAVKAPVAIY